MDNKLVRCQNPPSRRRRRRFPWGDALAVLLMLALCGFALSSPSQPPAQTPLPRSAASEKAPVAQTEDDGWELTLVNGEHAIPENWDITLQEVPGGQKVDARIYAPLMELLEAAKAGNWGLAPKVVSGYRTQEKQQSLYDDKVAKYEKQGYAKDEAKELAEQWVAVPGYSEHQIGLAVDINGATYDLYLWLQDNSYKYGFIFRYPGDKTDLTGVAEEVWHYRYVGVEAATRMYEQGLCLEEYLAQAV